jgi:RNA polymerase sigma-70 factor, ECF subfamily
MADEQQEIRWVLRAQAGDRAAFNELFQLVAEPLYRYVVSLIGTSTHAEDILQEIFILIYRKIVWLREPALFRAWTYRLASREAFRYIKRERQSAPASLSEELLATLSIPSRAELLAELSADLPRLIANISPASREVIVLHYLHELTIEEIAIVIDAPVGTVKSRLAYGLASLRKQYQQ